MAFQRTILLKLPIFEYSAQASQRGEWISIALGLSSYSQGGRKDAESSETLVKP
jgi:hypothetical protein